MKAIKRTVAALLATLMLATSTSFTLAAETYSDAEAVAVAKVNAAKVMTGTDKGFEPTKTLTRAEAAAIFVRMKGISESTVKQNAGETLFTDVAASHWAAGYINVASNYSIIKGVGANLFAPEKEVSVAEFYTMAVRALGAGMLVDSEGTWPTNYVNFAIENDLAEDVQQIYTATATRITAAIIAANTLEGKLWEKSQVKSNGEITWEAKNKTIIEDVLKFVTKDEDGHNLVITPRTSISNVDKTIDGNDCVDDLDLSNIKIGMTYEYWLNKDGDIAGLWIPTSNDHVEFAEIKDYKVKSGYAEVTLVSNGKEKTYKIDLTKNESNVYTKLPTVVKNEKEVALDTAVAQNTANKVTLAAQFADSKNIDGIAYVDDNYIKQLYITEFTAFAAVKDATDKKVTFQSSSDYVGFASSSLSLTTKDKEYFLTKNGKAMDFSDLKEDDVIRYYTVSTGAGKIVAEVVEPAASGEVKSTRRKADDSLASIKIDGTSYDVSNGAWTIKPEDVVTIYLNNAGKVVAYIKDKEAAADYGYIKYARKYNDGYSDNLEIQLVLSDGTVTDKMVIDIDETKKEYDKENKTFTISGDTAELDGATIAALGQTICYNIKNGKVVICPVSNDAEYVKLATNTDLVVTNKTMKLGEYYLTDNTKIYKMKEISNKTYELDVEEIDVEDLDNTLVKANSYVAGIDKDTKEIDTLYLEKTTSVARTGEANFAFITKVWSTKDGDDTVNEIEVILMDGSKETYLVSKDRTLLNSATIAAGEFVDLTVNNNKVTKLDKLNASGNDSVVRETLTNTVIRKSVTNNRYALGSVGVTEKAIGTLLADNDYIDGVKYTDVTSIANLTDADDKTTVKLYSIADHKFFTTAAKAFESVGEIIISDEILVLEVNAAGDKWTVKELSDIESYKDLDELGASTEVDLLTLMAAYKEDSADVYEVKLLVFRNDVELN